MFNRFGRTIASLVALAVILMLSVPSAQAAGKGRKSAALSTKDIVETAVAAGSFKTLATALTEAGLIETLKGKGPFTVFAPTDDAFAKIPKETLAALLKDKEALKKVLLYHVVSGEVEAKTVLTMNGKTAKTVQGQEVSITVKGKTVMVDASTVTKTDIKCSNGVIHVIDTVLMPK
jgi:uncharacterized surface protein with fasciclin (FAS1) repeats